MELVNAEIEKYTYDHTSSESEILQELIATTENALQYSQMLCGRVEGRLLRMLIQLSKAKKVLEVGMFTGYSALTMAEALPEDGQVITCDTNERYKKIAESFFKKSPFGHKIKIKIGPALQTIPGIKDVFDMIFLDADKKNYPEYYPLLIGKLKKGGILVVDNALWSGSVLKPEDSKSKAIDKLNKMILEDERVENVMLTIRDGIHIVQKIV